MASRSGCAERQARRRRLAGVLVAGVVMLPGGGFVATGSVRAASIDTPAIRRAVATTQPSVVFIFVRISGSLFDSRDGTVHGPLVASSKGTGCFVNPDGTIVTATHVVIPAAADIKVALVDRYIVATTGSQLETTSAGFAAFMAATSVRDVTLTPRVITQGMTIPPGAGDDDLFRLGRPAVMVAASPITATDISVIAINGRDEPATLLQSGPVPTLGVPVGLIGYPRMSPRFSVAPSFTVGPLTFVGHGSSSIGLATNTPNVANDATVLGTDAFAEHGDSGGPGVDEQAHVIGLVSFGADSGQPIFLVSAADIAGVLAAAHRRNALGAADQRWRSGLAASDRGSLHTALADFQACAASSPDNSGCRSWAQRTRAQLAAASSGPITAFVVIGLAAVGLLMVVTWWRRRSLPTG